MYHTPLVDIFTAVGPVQKKKRTASETSHRELSEDVSLGSGTLLGRRAIELGAPPPGGHVVYTAVVHGKITHSPTFGGHFDVLWTRKAAVWLTLLYCCILCTVFYGFFFPRSH